MNLRNLNDLNFRLRVEDLVGQPTSVLDRIRRECQTNLRFLANCVMRPLSTRFLSLSESCHGRMIDAFLQPDPDKPFDEWSSVKERVIKASRGMLKSTIGPAHLVQLQLCDPNIRILIISGVLKKSKSILETSRTPFANNEVIRFLFPEWSVDLTDIGGDEFVSPMRDPDLNLRDPTLSIATFESVKAGGHFEVIDFDDCTNEINSATAELVEKNVQYYDDTDPLVEPGGYRTFKGTTWADDASDLPEVIRRRGEQEAEDTGTNSVIYVSIPAWVLREGKDEVERQAIDERDRKNQLTPEDVVLTWPEKLSAKVLWPKYRGVDSNKQNKFLMQYLLRFTRTMANESFPHSFLVKATRPYAEGAPMAHDRLSVVNWDLAGVYSGVRNKSASDFFCGLAAMFELSTQRMFLYDAILEIFMSSTDIANAIVSFYARQLRIGPVHSCDIEDSYGARNLEGEILRIAKVAKVPIKLNFQPRSTAPGAKVSRITKLAGAAKRGLVQFSTTLPQRDLIFSHFEKWHPSHKKVKDDAPDCAAQLWEHYAGSIYPGMFQNMGVGRDNYAPEPIPMAVEEIDPHADEKECADIAWLQSMTVPHA